MHNPLLIARRKIHSTWTYPAMALSDYYEGSYDEDFSDYIPEELIEQHDHSCNCPSIFVAATEASMWFSAVLPIGGCAIASRSQSLPRSGGSNGSGQPTSGQVLDLINGSF